MPAIFHGLTMRIVHLVVTSPPYGLLKTYAEVLGPSITVAGSRASVVCFVCSDGDAARLIAFFHGHRVRGGRRLPKEDRSPQREDAPAGAATLRFKA